MKLTTRRILEQIKEFWKAKSKKTQRHIIGLLLAFVAVAVLAAVFLNNSGYVTLYEGLSSSEMGDIVSKLNEMEFDFKVKTGGTILVPKEKEAQVLMTMASEGYPQSALNYDIFTNNSGFMTTEYEKKQYLLFLYQNRLQDAIKTIKGVKSAIVTISLPDEDSFVLEEDKVPATASVVLSLASGTEPSTKQIKGIENLVSSSIAGLDRKNIAIVSNTGETLNDQYDDEKSVNSNTRFELEKNISNSIEKKIVKLLSPVFGYDSIRVAVNTLVDINKTVSEQTTYEPVVGENGMIERQDSVKENVASGNTAGGVPGTATNSGVTTYQEPTGSDNKGNYSESSSTNYLNNQTVEQVEREGYEIKDITVSVLIGNQQLTQSQIADYKQMVAFAAGTAADKVVINNAVFTAENSGNTAEPSGSFLKNNIIYIGGAGAALAVAFIVLQMLKKRKQKQNREQEPALAESVFEDTPLDPKAQFVDEIILNETREQNLKRQIKDFSSGSPDIVAQLIRTWLKEDDENE